jgi:hypothetical protein
MFSVCIFQDVCHLIHFSQNNRGGVQRKKLHVRAIRFARVDIFVAPFMPFLCHEYRALWRERVSA